MSTETSTRPFQVDDRVRITDYDVMTGKTVRTHTGKIRSLKDMSDPDASDWVTLIAEVDQPYLMGKSGTLHTVALVHLIPDRTRSTWPSNQTIELLEPAPIDPAAVQVGDTVTVERPSSNDRVDGVVNDVSPEGFVLDGWGKRFRLGDDYDGMWTLTGHQPAPPTEAPQDHGPLAAPLSDRTLDKVLSRPTRVFGFNVVTISPQGIPGGPRLDGIVSRQRAQDELDELEPFMVDGWKTVMVELREVTS